MTQMSKSGEAENGMATSGAELANAILSDDERREVPRRRILWNGNVTCGSHNFSCTVKDISLGGAALAFDLPLTEDAEVELTIPQYGSFPARVAWSGGKQMGIRFADKVEDILARFGDAANRFGLTDGTAYAA